MIGSGGFMQAPNTHESREDAERPVDRLVILPMPEGMTRPETGAMQFGDDWPGVFIRGDNAACYSMALDSLLSGNVEPMTAGILSGLNELLKSSRAT